MLSQPPGRLIGPDAKWGAYEAVLGIGCVGNLASVLVHYYNHGSCSNIVRCNSIMLRAAYWTVSRLSASSGQLMLYSRDRLPGTRIVLFGGSGPSHEEVWTL